MTPTPRPSIIYLSGPMAGLPLFNYPAFEYAAAALRRQGHTVVSPHECGSGTWEACMKRDIAAMMVCDTIALLPGWRESRGAQIELGLARALGYTIRYVRGGMLQTTDHEPPKKEDLLTIAEAREALRLDPMEDGTGNP